MKGFALGLALKQRRNATRKSPKFVVFHSFLHLTTLKSKHLLTSASFDPTGLLPRGHFKWRLIQHTWYMVFSGYGFFILFCYSWEASKRYISLLWRRANARNVSQHTLYSVQHIHINLTLIHCTIYQSGWYPNVASTSLMSVGLWMRQLRSLVSFRRIFVRSLNEFCR